MRTLPVRLLVVILLCIAACRSRESVVQTGGSHPLPHATTTTAAPSPSVTPSTSGKDETKVVKFDADTHVTTPSGSTYIAPKGWTVTTKSGFILLEDPNREVSVRFVERKERDGTAAIAAAWKQVEPGFARKVLFTSPWPGRSGWDAFVFVSYETTVDEVRFVWAKATRKADTWFVALFDGTREGWNRRGAQANIAHGSFRAKGVVEESFAGKTAQVLIADRLGKLEAFIEDGRRISNIPGLAVAVVQGGKVVLERASG